MYPSRSEKDSSLLMSYTMIIACAFLKYELVNYAYQYLRKGIGVGNSNAWHSGADA